ncbi:MAG: hypothetical protein HDQ99_04425 [Lachnospiraceae bacterium]|nr:hypothetical protein [Lachnospiraceae bacterium]
MKKAGKNQQYRTITAKKSIIVVIILLIVAPFLINVGLGVTDIISDKWGIALTAKGLSNESWLDFWKYYMSTSIAFLGVYLVWDTSNKDRKNRDNKESSDRYLNRVSIEENTLVEVVQCFNMGILYKALNQMGETTLQECKAALQSARDKIDEMHVKFELSTDIVDDFERCNGCEHNPCLDKEIKKEISRTFYDMESHYTNLLNLGDSYLNKLAAKNCNTEKTEILSRIMDNIKSQISYMQQNGSSHWEFMEKQEELSNVEKQIKELSKAKISQEDMDKMLQSADKEVKYLSNERAKLIGYCKNYINMQKEHARELKNNGIIKYVKIKQN